MTIELSKMFGMDIYSIDAEYIGKAYDFVIDLGQGRVSKITLEPLRAKSKREAAEILKKKSISYDKVVAVKDIILIDPKKTAAQNNVQRKNAVSNTFTRLGIRRNTLGL